MIAIVTPNRDEKFKSKLKALYGKDVKFIHASGQIDNIRGMIFNKVYRFGTVNLKSYEELILVMRTS